MEVKLIMPGHYIVYSNCYGVVSDEAAIVIDPGKCKPEVVNFLKSNKDKETLILLTHAHYDHISGADELREITGAKIAIGATEAPSLRNPHFNLTDSIRTGMKPFYADIIFCDEQEITVGDITVKAIETPGHTKGSMCYLIENNLFTGDTLFYESVGRTDLPGGDSDDLLSSLNRIMLTFDDNIKVFSGHGEPTTIGHEREYNPYMR